MNPDGDVSPLAAGHALGDRSLGRLGLSLIPVIGTITEGQRDEPVGAARRATDQVAHGAVGMNLSSGRKETVSDLDENGLYCPGTWTRDQLVGFANELDSLVPAGRETAVDLGIIRAVKALRDNGVETFESCEGGEGHSMTEPTVRFLGEVEAGWKALSICLTYGLPVRAHHRGQHDALDGQASKRAHERDRSVRRSDMTPRLWCRTKLDDGRSGAD